ncbi:hypothetical protein NKH77_21620 [Streptomyces sp. M19]
MRGGAAWHRRRTRRPWTRKAVGGVATSTPPISGCSTRTPAVMCCAWTLPRTRPRTSPIPARVRAPPQSGALLR